MPRRRWTAWSSSVWMRLSTGSRRGLRRPCDWCWLRLPFGAGLMRPMRREGVDVKALYLAEDRVSPRYIEIPGDDPPWLWLHGWQCSSTGELLPAAVQPPLRGRRSLLIDFLG